MHVRLLLAVCTLLRCNSVESTHGRAPETQPCAILYPGYLHALAFPSLARARSNRLTGSAESPYTCPIRTQARELRCEASPHPKRASTAFG
jgi:hypothetical protein